MNKQAQLMLKTLIGILIGVLLFVLLLATARNILSSGKKADFKKSFEEFAHTLQKMSSQSADTIATPLVKIEDDSVIIGIGPAGDTNHYDIVGVSQDASDEEITTAYNRLVKEYEGKTSVQEQLEMQQLQESYNVLHNTILKKEFDEEYNSLHFKNGRFWDGNFYVVLNALNAQLRENKEALIQFKRPAVCDKENSCVCLCTNPKLTEITTEERKALAIDTKRKTPYDTKSHQHMKSSFIYAIPQEKSFVATCNEITSTCVELEQTTFYYLKEGLHDDTSRVSSNNNYKEPLHMFENGFLLDKNGALTSYLLNEQPQDIPVTVRKLSNSELAVCLRRECVAEIEEDIINNQLTPQDIKLASLLEKFGIENGVFKKEKCDVCTKENICEFFESDTSSTTKTTDTTNENPLKKMGYNIIYLCKNTCDIDAFEKENPETVCT